MVSRMQRKLENEKESSIQCYYCCYRLDNSAKFYLSEINNEAQTYGYVY
jgi:hypothetical protein